MAELVSFRPLLIRFKQVRVIFISCCLHFHHVCCIATPAVDVVDLLKETNKESFTPLHVATEVLQASILLIITINVLTIAGP